MNLNHRVADRKDQHHISNIIHVISYPLSWMIPLVIIGINIYHAANFFGGEWQIGNFSTDVVPFLSSLIASILNTTAAIVMSQIVLLGFVFGPISLYFFTLATTKRYLPSIVTALLVSLPLVPWSSQIPERLDLAVNYNDGAHIIGLSFVMLVAYLFLKYDRWGKTSDLIWFCLGILGLTLISFFSIQISTIFMLTVAMSEALVDHGKMKLKRLLIGLSATAVIVILVYNFSLVHMLTAPEVFSAEAVLGNMLPLSFVIFPILGTFAFLIFDRRPSLQPLFIAFFSMIIFSMLHFIRITFVDIPMFDQDRYAAELSFGRSLFIGIMTMLIFEMIRSGRIGKNNPVLYQHRSVIAFILVGSFIIILLGLNLIPRS